MLNDNENRVQTREIDYKQAVQKAWGKEWAKPDPGYEFSNGRKFDTPKEGGPYGEQE